MNTVNCIVIRGGVEFLHVVRDVDAVIEHQGKEVVISFPESTIRRAQAVFDKRQGSAEQLTRPPRYGASWDFKSGAGPILAELALAILTGGNWLMFSDGDLDSSRPDVSPFYQSRHTTHPRARYLLTHHEDRDDQVFVAFSGSPQRMTAKGWMWGKDTKTNWSELTPGRPCFVTPFSALHSMSTIKEAI